ncbi:DNA-directed RNA polymerase sigma-70 factor [Actinocatenispora thailandica]|uniref:DNA-directed RNA polymerase sigma-70 factor n=1 Tax=Actinocatenispora thailandica TaxID=227318 RepID=A0A7R7DWW3_9ACTN|nr:SigE family RNA polymerase sigma factor [Actinocatenispora thailandica]BCJ39095.1 DNA-directed RNA polymerase sigma-70 factor [Actinocatenispora thailandica]
MDAEREFAEYFAARGQAMRRMAYALCGDWHTAEDLVQSTFVRLYRHWRTIRRPTVDAYARRTLLNLFLSRRRGAWREQVVPEVPERVAAAPGTEDRIDLARALALLSPRQRAMVVLRYLEDQSVAEVAELLGVAEGTVKSQTARGVQALRTALGDRVLSGR